MIDERYFEIERLRNERDVWRNIADLFYIGSGATAVEEYERMERMQRMMSNGN